MKTCLIKTSSMGDIIHTLPALTDAKRAVPNLKVDWVVERPFMEIPCWHPAVKNVIPVALRHWRKNLLARQTWREWNDYQQQLRATTYTKVIDVQGLLKSAVFATHFAKGEKYGYDFRSAREGLSSLFYDHKFEINYQQHAVERVRQLFAQTFGYKLPENRGDYGIADYFQKMTAHRDALRVPTILAIHSTTREEKHWAEDYWVELFALLANQPCEIHLPWGNSLEHERAIRLAKVAPNIKVLPKLTLTELAAHMMLVKTVVSVDTGLAHLAAALNKQNVVLYGATDPKLIGTYGQNQHHLHADSMLEIFPKQVFEKLNCLTFDQ